MIQNQYHQRNTESQEVDNTEKYLHSQNGNGLVVKQNSNEYLPPGTLDVPSRKRKRKTNTKWLKY